MRDVVPRDGVPRDVVPRDVVPRDELARDVVPERSGVLPLARGVRVVACRTTVPELERGVSLRARSGVVAAGTARSRPLE